MPFTLSHPAAVVPLAQRGLPFSALVIGSMAPDFPYFIHSSTVDTYGHTLSGVFLFCIPNGLAVLWFFHVVAKLPLLSLLPLSHQERLMPLTAHFQVSSVRHLFLAIIALVVGAFTHIFWDSFTHYNGWGVHHFPVLWHPLIQVRERTFFAFDILQAAGGIMGVAVIFYSYFAWLHQAPRFEVKLQAPISPKSRLYFVVSITLVAFISAGVFSHSYEFSGYELLRRVIVSAIKVFLFELLLFSCYWHFSLARTLAGNVDN